ncbi:MAG: hypothetical protein ACFFDT_13875 [Candidatus Hodarchaeota archaeon]
MVELPMLMRIILGIILCLILVALIIVLFLGNELATNNGEVLRIGMIKVIEV